MKKIKHLPKTENGHGVRYTLSNGEVYIISYNINTMKFTLWKEQEDGYEKIGTSSDPEVLYKKCK